MGEGALWANPRYRLLTTRSWRRAERTSHRHRRRRRLVDPGRIIPEAACTSTQLHVQVSPDEFPQYWNAAQAIAGVQLALAANSPYLLGRELWRETRIPLFEQATDTRGEELKPQGVRPRVWFGERWVTSIFDLFEENVRYFSALLPVCEDEDPLAALECGGSPPLAEIRLHNGTIYRWNRPVYDVVDGSRMSGWRTACWPPGPPCRHHGQRGLLLRAGAGPGRASGRCGRRCRSRPRPKPARRGPAGLDARVYWPGSGRPRPPSWSCAGCCRWPAKASPLGRRPARSDRLLGIIEQRCLVARNGADLAIETMQHSPSAGRPAPGAARPCATPSGCTATSRCTPGPGSA